ncbi:hypothetical protein O6H91_03G053500 [Diphasiastrum complanatum]|uniref:Uncharacterized protein n=1 Tax=Diphasiastrum complanatum TaxID=34168 RepID=A0ACC2E6R1_DIPCM|nr:hypothetical protein O6H91_03G053500 [Diphasiastrum complanatum]
MVLVIIFHLLPLKLSLISPQNHFEEKRNWCIGLPSTQEFLDVSPKESNYLDGTFPQNEEQSKHSLAVAAATAAAAQAAVAAAEAAAAVVRLTGVVRTSFHGWNPNEEWAAVKIQAAFRAYLARRAFRALKALVRLQAWARGHRIRRQSALAMRCIQALARVQTRVRARRDKIAKDSEAIQQQLWERSQRESHRKKSLIDVSAKEGWDDSSQSAKVLEMKRNKQLEAAMKRERALAYAYSQKQWRTDPKEASSIASTYNDYEQDNPHWGWGWLEHWMAAVPLENSALENHGFEEFSETEEKEITDSAARLSTSSNRKQTLPPAKMRASPSRGSSVKQATAPKRPLTVRVHPASPRSKRITDDNPSPISIPRDTPPTTIRSFIRSNASESFNWEDERMISSPESPSYMLPTQFTQARSRSNTKPKPTNIGTPERNFAASNDRRLSLPMPQTPTKSPSFRGAFTPMKTTRRSAIDSSIGTSSSIGYGRQPFR